MDYDTARAAPDILADDGDDLGCVRGIMFALGLELAAALIAGSAWFLARMATG